MSVFTGYVVLLECAVVRNSLLWRDCNLSTGKCVLTCGDLGVLLVTTPKSGCHNDGVCDMTLLQKGCKLFCYYHCSLENEDLVIAICLLR